ncbi:MAG: 3-hydroxyacyl-CoA dehydrogenase family protein [Candidatus Krumholzibacteria bacterium]|nr:3-hydroxyacyl-CoA dehydrogenase family protein [Candidatus Krumholzibacteria bacterium]MDH4336176.1 3-hydroxyacyl-CoA dehydrogenase family protein [Candidatus Krumholzibacteria bacterium]MDH5268817.1 3-hydroxyacyl-CoA dehydrogenase family protein [Candidatus Krumholzibacteria bacterium]
MKKVGVVGCGLMGSGIAQISALAGYTTHVVEINDDILKKGMAKIEESMEKGKKRGKITEEQFAAARKNLSSSTGLASLKDCDLVIEAVTENTELKKKLFKDLSGIVRGDTILATNTSSISVTEIAAVVDKPERMVGMHFFNPVPVMKLVEIIKGHTTSDTVMAACREFAVAVGKEPITCPDTPAFVVNKLLIPYLLDAVRMVQDGVATPEDVDKAMVYGCGYPMGPITLLDYVGLDTTLHAADVMYAEFRESKYAAPVLLRRMVQAGHWGRKTGRGFYAYEGK